MTKLLTAVAVIAVVILEIGGCSPSQSIFAPPPAGQAGANHGAGGATGGGGGGY
jgi:hypothetical protein